MTKRRLLAITLIFILTLSGIRFAWIFAGLPPDRPIASQGVLDLRATSLDRPLQLEGEWLFYPERFLLRPNGDSPAASLVVSLPGSWQGYFGDPNLAIGYGSYRLRVLLGDAPGERRLTLQMPPAMSASELYVDGVRLGASGIPGRTADETVANEAPYHASFSTDRSEVDIVVHVANFVNPVNGGLLQSVQLGPEAEINRHKLFSIAMQLLVCVVLLIHVLYVGVLFFMGVRQRALASFALTMICACLSVLVTDDKLLLAWLDLPYGISFRLYTLSYLWATALLLVFMKQLYPALQKRPWDAYYGVTVLGLTAAVTLMPEYYVAWVDLYTIPLLLIGNLYAPVLTLRATLRVDRDAIFLWLGLVALAGNLIWGVSSGFIYSLRPWSFYPVDIIVAFTSFACYWFKLYFKNMQRTARLAGELQKADKQKDDFLANTSHELRNPLHGMINIAHSVLERERVSPDGRERLELLVSVGKRMSLLLNDLLDMERLKGGGLRLQPQPVQVHVAVAGVIDMMRLMAEGKPVELRNDIPASFPPVLADENRLVQILFNLMHNAVKFTTHGQIAIKGFVRDGTAVLEVHDTGVGIEAEALRRVFEPYERSDSALAAIGGGLGLGLSISRQLAERLGGSLEAESELGRGSTFRLTLPVAAERLPAANPETAAGAAGRSSGTAEPVSDPTPAQAGYGTPRVLVVDDDPINLHILEGMLPGDAYRIAAVSSAHEALQAIDENEWDLVVTDVMMPRMSGYELTRIIRNRFTMSELPVLLLTARSQPEDIAAGFQAGANDYVAKPADRLELQHRVKALTAMKRTTAERMRLEAALLQAQVQPHFLFNTLNSIAALSAIDHERMQSLLTVFGRYLKASFDFRNSERLVPLEKELALVESYLFIERERFRDRLRVQWDMPKHLLSTPVPPLSIQTLVENGVRHGIMKRMRGGTIRIAAEDLGEEVEIRVEDDGVGIPEEVQRQVLEDASAASAGIGLRNTNRRLRQIFGKGLIFASVPGQGTSIAFRIRKSGD